MKFFQSPRTTQNLAKAAELVLKNMKKAVKIASKVK